MILTQEEALVRISERVAENKKKIDRMLKQRRNQVVDMYGVEFTRQGAANAPARFYISISPDMVYLERFEFKLIVQPFLSMAGTIGATSLSVSGSAGGYDVITAQDLDNILNADNCNSLPDDTGGEGGSLDGISPNPHTHSVTAGITPIATTANDFRVRVEGIDVTPYLMAQYGGAWLNGEGVYPSLKIGEDYDLLEVASDLIGEGRKADADKIMSSGYKAIEITASSPFSITLVLYSKYSHLNR